MRSFETTQPALLYLWVRLPATKLDDERVKALPKMRLEINNCQNGTAAASVRARAFWGGVRATRAARILTQRVLF